MCSGRRRQTSNFQRLDARDPGDSRQCLNAGARLSSHVLSARPSGHRQRWWVVVVEATGHVTDWVQQHSTHSRARTLAPRAKPHQSSDSSAAAGSFCLSLPENRQAWLGLLASTSAPPSPLHSHSPLTTGGVQCVWLEGAGDAQMGDGWDGSPSQAATVPGYSLGLQCSHSASAPTRSHLTRRLGSWGASELRAEAGIGPEARIALPHRPFANTHEYVHACTAVQVCKSRAQHGGQAPSSRPGAEALFWKPFFARPRLSHAHWTTGWPLHPCLLKSLARPPPSFSLGPIISFHLSNAMQSMPACWPLLVCRLDEP